ncbi:hypothetical protein GCM10007962_01310 [Yeosuana aromativorans]|uniref:Thioredoxin domain-containing protein n=1 Tax=Yeosuana aromativorans TaxID=288019 RepID=A0A8J3BCE5_9FLAO|nr:vitamin K epoxide reductase family protein [Yeosuana aromativorans]GGK10958.1 hypothetical protein GCM10007962_01310 [Yeosuana aromativorans]
MDSLKTLFYYLEAENISVDKEEFDFQFNSHPDYPSLLALNDTLKFFNINCGAFKVNKSEIELLPNKFIARLKKEDKDFLSFVVKKDSTFIYTNGSEQKYPVSKHDFESLWDDVVLLVEYNETILQPKSKNLLYKLLLLLTVTFFVSILFMILPNIWFSFFCALPIIGLIFSIAALKDLFITKSELLDKFCHVTSLTSCNTVINSTKWKLLDTISFSDLSIIFFSTQIIALFLMGLSNHATDYFYIQTKLLLIASPVLMASLYYQKYIEKKWCPICLVIIGVVITELSCVFILKNSFDFSIDPFGLLLFLTTAALLMSIWFPLKNSLKKINHLKAVELKANRLKRNYELFSKMLKISEHYNLPESLLVFGNQKAPLRIHIITSPYCGHCKDPHYILKSVLDKYEEQLNISMLYNLNPKNSRLRTFLTSLITLSKENQLRFYEAMDYWYETKDDEKWLSKYKINIGAFEIEPLLKSQHLWFKEHGFNFTPCLFINGYQYPKAYDIADLPFFIEELIDDKSYSKKLNKLKEAEAEKL